MSRKTKLLKLSKLIDLETEVIKKGAFAAEDRLFRKLQQKKQLDSVMQRCRECPGMNIRSCTEAVMGGPNVESFVVIVGQSPCEKCMVAGTGFVKGSGYYLDAALRLSDLRRIDIFLTNVIHCHPPRDAANTAEQTYNCIPFLRRELEIVQPRLVVALGTPAREAIVSLAQEIKERFHLLSMKHPAYFMHKGDPEGIKDWIIKLSTELDWYKGD